ncbi:MAG: hypothetical protein M1816_007433 [Peltula sp. TS41687]|nr:MAG: hypothetical protein M1816_007433 [Peltula sp. TS41687]
MSLGQALDQAGREHLGPSPRTLAFLLGYPGDPVLALFLDARNANVRRRLLAEMGLGNHVNHIGIRSTWFDTLNTFLVQLTEREQNAFYYHKLRTLGMLTQAAGIGSAHPSTVDAGAVRLVSLENLAAIVERSMPASSAQIKDPMHPRQQSAEHSDERH